MTIIRMTWKLAAMNLPCSDRRQGDPDFRPLRPATFTQTMNTLSVQSETTRTQNLITK